MIWKAKTKPDYKVGDYKSIEKFAWLPRNVKEYWVWLESYTEVYIYSYRIRSTVGYRFACYGWDFIGYKPIEKKGLPDFEFTPEPPKKGKTKKEKPVLINTSYPIQKGGFTRPMIISLVIAYSVIMLGILAKIFIDYCK